MTTGLGIGGGLGGIPLSFAPPTTIVVTSPSTAFPALTTSFQPPSSCDNRYYAEKASGGQVSSGTLDPLYESCQPTTSATIYSPGMCPDAMETVSIFTNQSVYTEVCCQSGFSWDFRGCSSAITSTTVVFQAPWTSSTASLTTVSSVVATHQAITVLWRDADLGLFPSDLAARRRQVEASLSSSGDSSTSSTSAPDSTFNTDTPKPAVPSATILTQKAQIGIGVGAAAGGLLIVSVAAFLWRTRRRPRRTVSVASDDEPNPYELDTTGATWKRWLKNTWRAELPSDSVEAELGAGDPHTRGAELPADDDKGTEASSSRDGGDEQREESDGKEGMGGARGKEGKEGKEKEEVKEEQAPVELPA